MNILHWETMQRLTPCKATLFLSGTATTPNYLPFSSSTIPIENSYSFWSLVQIDSPSWGIDFLSLHASESVISFRSWDAARPEPPSSASLTHTDDMSATQPACSEALLRRFCLVARQTLWGAQTKLLMQLPSLCCVEKPAAPGTLFIS